MPNGITPIIPEIYYKVRTIYGRDQLSLNTNPYSYEILSTLVRLPSLTYSRTKLSTSVRCLFLVRDVLMFRTPVRTAPEPRDSPSLRPMVRPLPSRLSVPASPALVTDTLVTLGP